MKIDVKVEGLDDLGPSLIPEAERAVTRGIAMGTDALKQLWRADVTRALGPRLARTIRAATYPQSGEPSLSAAGLVRTNAPQIVGPFERGAVIKSPSGFFLAIPTEAAGKSLRRGRITPGEWERRHGQRLRFVYRRGRASLLVAEARQTASGRAGRANRTTKSGRLGSGAATIPIFVLVPQVTLKKRLNLMAIADQMGAKVPQLIVNAWR